MEQFLKEVIEYAHATKRSPQHILRQAVGANWNLWSAWVGGSSSPTLHTVDRIRLYIRENPVTPHEDVA